MDQSTDTKLLGVFIGAFFALFAAFMRILSMPENARPSKIQIAGRLGISWCAGWLVGSAVNYYIPSFPGDLSWGIAGAAGFFGDRVYLALGDWVDKRWGTSLARTHDKTKAK